MMNPFSRNFEKDFEEAFRRTAETVYGQRVKTDWWSRATTSGPSAYEYWRATSPDAQIIRDRALFAKYPTAIAIINQDGTMVYREQ